MILRHYSCGVVRRFLLFALVLFSVAPLLAADSVTMQELTFMKRKILKGIAKAMPTSGVKDLRFRMSGH